MRGMNSFVLAAVAGVALAAAALGAEAQTGDGLWAFEREDSPGTPWLVYHLPSCRDGSYAMPVHLTGTLRACREYVAAGHAQASLERLQAHERGEHNAARDSWCGRC